MQKSPKPDLPRRALFFLPLFALAACGWRRDDTPAAGSAEVNRLIAVYSDRYGVPESLVHRVVRAESGYDPLARNGPYYGLMQLLPATAATMGYRGEPVGLLDASTNLRYGVRYLRGAWIVGNRNADRAVMWYRKGYYYEAKRRGLLEETGLRG
ncbi:MAG: transglycosylase SLT domain-containing protein [Paracoccaceae bacterium]